jgi:cytoskeletal protein CcmA (bactofilin family)
MVFANVKGDESHSDQVIASAQEEIRRLARDGDALHLETASSISSGLSIVGKIVGHGALTIFGHVEGECQTRNDVLFDGNNYLGCFTRS